MTAGGITKPAMATALLLVVGMSVAPSAPTLQITDVLGLANALAVRPMAGIGYATNRAAIINAAAQIEAAAGNLGDCVRVDGSSGPCGSSVGPSFTDNETPQGSVNGVNHTFTLQVSPLPPTSLHLYANGLRLVGGGDYTLAGNTITFTGTYVPGQGDTILADYRH
jgi:hypothetical protein